MHNKVTEGVWVAFAVATTLLLTGCEDVRTQMPGMVVWQADGGAKVVVPVCAGETLLGADYWQGQALASVSLSDLSDASGEQSRLVDLAFDQDALVTGAIAPGASPASVARFPAGTGFADLTRVDVKTTASQFRVDPNLVNADAEAVWAFWEYPFGKNDPVLEAVSESDGRQRLLEWCEEGVDEG